MTTAKKNVNNFILHWKHDKGEHDKGEHDKGEHDKEGVWQRILRLLVFKSQ